MGPQVRILPGAPFPVSFGHSSVRLLGCDHRPFEGGISAGDTDILVSHFDTFDQQLDILTPHPRVRASQLLPEEIAESGDDLWGDAAIFSFELMFKNIDVGLSAHALCSNVGDLTGDVGIVRTEGLVADELDNQCALAVQCRQAGAKTLQFRFALRNRSCGTIKPGLQERVESLGLREMVGYSVGDDRIEFHSRNPPALTLRRALIRAAQTGVIAMPAGASGSCPHRGPATIVATATDGALGEEACVGLLCIDAHFRIAICHLLTDGVEGLFADDWRHGDGNPFRFRSNFTGA
nr:hypothetical protein [Sphingomonas sp. CL5.1]